MTGYTVVEVTPETASLIPPLLYRGFGYTYTDAAMYQTDSILAAMHGGRNTYFIGIDGSGQARALLALRFRYPLNATG